MKGKTKVTTATILFIIFILSFSVCVGFAVHEIKETVKEVGLKNIVNTIWEGER